ncbi:MAG: hypothetical protein FJ147_10625 [Deltaproteobacteria bacterium]|nr:hypothetical protein [Deltaproteobacteria bacterium]
MLRTVVLVVGAFGIIGWQVTLSIGGGRDTVEVSVNELRKINQRLQQLEEDVRAKEERIKKLEGQLTAGAPAPKAVTASEEQQETRLRAIESTLAAPFGGEFSLMPGGHSGPFGTGTDVFIAGALDLPIWRKDPLFGQKLLGEVMIGYGRSTDNGVFVTPLTLMAPGMGLPQGARILSNKAEAKFLQVFLGAKYKLVDYTLGGLQNYLQPYVVTGLGLNVVLGRTTRAGIDLNGDGRPDVSLKSAGFPGGLIGGVTPEAPELHRRGFPTGQGNIKIAYSIGGGADIKLTERIFVGTDVRYNILEGGGDYATYTGKVGFMW